MKKIISSGLVLSFMPVLAFARTDAVQIITRIHQLLNLVIPVLIAFAVVYFIWGVIMYVISGDETKKKEARGHVISGLIGLFVIVAFWGIIGVITNTFGVGSTRFSDNNALPCIPGPGFSC
jgi:hypothetical protein